ncbi:hypothetical protein HYU17_04065 [Candidatus Woesearchaeota archaeon]|nr:hypothetical protein [Candidatus Woesearchaeota archaeon]
MILAAGKGVVALDFDGCIACGANVKASFAREKWGLELAVEQTAEDMFPFGHEKYRQMMDVVGRRTSEYELAPCCREACEMLRDKGFKLAVVTSREDYELDAAKRFISEHRLPLAEVYNTRRAGKKAICGEIGAVALLEDSLWKLVELEGTGVKLYFMEQKWNVHEQPKALELEFVVPVNGWQHFYRCLAGEDFETAKVVGHAAPS